MTHPLQEWAYHGEARRSALSLLTKNIKMTGYQGAPDGFNAVLVRYEGRYLVGDAEPIEWHPCYTALIPWGPNTGTTAAAMLSVAPNDDIQFALHKHGWTTRWRRGTRDRVKVAAPRGPVHHR